MLRHCPNDPPDRVAAEVARSDRRLASERSLVALEGGVDDAALARFVHVIQEVRPHPFSLAYLCVADIGGVP